MKIPVYNDIIYEDTSAIESEPLQNQAETEVGTQLGRSLYTSPG